MRGYRNIEHTKVRVILRNKVSVLAAARLEVRQILRADVSAAREDLLVEIMERAIDRMTAQISTEILIEHPARGAHHKKRVLENDGQVRIIGR